MTGSADKAMAGVNAYAALVTADRWFAARRLAPWAEAPEAARHGALIRAADWLDTQFQFRGNPRDAAQPRAWPRAGVGAGPMPGGLPMPVQTAYFELAMALLEGEEAAERLLGIRGAIRRERIGGLAVDYGEGGGEGGRIRAMLAPYLRSGIATRVVRT